MGGPECKSGLGIARTRMITKLGFVVFNTYSVSDGMGYPAPKAVFSSSLFFSNTVLINDGQ